MQEYLTQVTRIKPLTLDVIELDAQLVGPSDLVFQAGQFMQFKIGNLYRSYSFATPPTKDNPTLNFCIKLEPQGVGSDFIRKLKVGSEIPMRGPAGLFVVQDLTQPTFFVATGVGIAPFASMIPDMLIRGSKANVQLLFGLRSEDNVFYYDKFSRLAREYENFKFTPVLSRPQAHWPGETGYVTTYLEVSYPHFKDYTFFLCGSKEVVADARAVLLKAGHEPKKIKLEIFT